MNSLKRLSATLVATIDKTVASMEDHEAVVASALKDSKKATARARFKLEKLKLRNQHLQARLAEAKAEHDKWQDRALSLKETNREDALRCLTARKRCAERIEALSKELSHREESARRMEASVNQLIQKTESLDARRSELSSRAATARATEIVNRIEEDSSLDVHETLDNWELSIVESEFIAGSDKPLPVSDSIEALGATLDSEEERAALNSELDALVDTGRTDGDRPGADNKENDDAI